MRQGLAFAILIACVRLCVDLNTAPIETSASEAYAHETKAALKGVEEPWLDAVEGIMSGPGGISRDSRPRPAMFR